jgi:hypothetical protein
MPLVVLLSLLVTAQQPALKIVVIEGEAGVNIIQQKTAVKPLIEVRDRNNNPVAGVVVTFSIEGGKAATFGGASTLTVATNAAGQAAVSSLTPNIAGAFQIQVSAAFQGQIATATIAQTNVLTAAQAAAASAATGSTSAGSASGGAGGGAGSAGGAAGGAGGGLSTTTIAIAGAAVAGGAAAATQVAKNGGAEQDTYSGSFTSTLTDVSTNRTTGQTCTTVRTFTGTAKLAIDVDNPSNVDGDLSLQGSAAPVSFTCGNNQATIPFGTSVKVSGPASSPHGSGTQTSTGPGPNGETITNNQSTNFEGSISGNTMTGTVTIESRVSQTGNPNGPSDGVQTTAISLSLTKS